MEIICKMARGIELINMYEGVFRCYPAIVLRMRTHYNGQHVAVPENQN